jgi:thiol-disulfide isomerase/thioredoxin
MTIITDIGNQMRLTANLLLSNKSWLMIGLLFTLLFVVISYYAFENLIKPSISGHKLNKEFKKRGSVDNSEDISIMYFYTEWCPYCKKAEPEWKKFEKYVDNINNTNDYNVTLTAIDCDEKKSVADKYKVEGYPSVKLFYKGEVQDFDAKVTKENLVQFLNSAN